MLDESTTGQALRRLRELSGMNERTAARRLGVRRAELRDWEEHRAAPDAAQLTRAIDVYGQDAETTLAIRRPLTEPDRPGVLVVGDEEIVIADHVRTAATSHEANEAVLASYLAAVRRQRSLAADAPVQLRSADISSLSIELDLTDDHLLDLLADLLQLTPAGAQYTTRALLVGGLVALMATGVVQAGWFTPTASASTTPTTIEAERVVFDAGDLGPTERGPAFSDAPRERDVIEAIVVDDETDVAEATPSDGTLQDGTAGPLAPPAPYAEVTPDEVPYAIFSIDPLGSDELHADGPTDPREAPNEGRSSVFSVTPRADAQAPDGSTDGRSTGREDPPPALGTGSPALPPAD
jgi:transcriptional regulator with XRE-family HTH domain